MSETQRIPTFMAQNEEGPMKILKLKRKILYQQKKKNQEGEPDQAVQHTKQLSEDFGD